MPTFSGPGDRISVGEPLLVFEVPDETAGTEARSEG
ncbi:hypothetical protein QFZ40_001372 [Arthrobacter pascens]|nr:hypothetical protein [Arthrobacter pascens]